MSPLPSLLDFQCITSLILCQEWWTNTMGKVHIVIPAFNNYQMLHELLWKLQRIEANNIASICLIDDCSTDNEVVGGMKWWASSYGSKFPILVINNSENMGFLRSANCGMRTVAGLPTTHSNDIIILLSTDVQVAYPFISQIRENFGLGKTIALVGGVLYTHDTGWNKFGDKIFPYLEGWLLASTKRGWEELGYFDERYSPNDFEDVDLSTKAISLGYNLVPLNNPGIVHLGGKSIGYSPEREAITKINQKKFEAKWIK